ncbi:tyrosine-protein kinase receptor torso [Onthophagus taurus]|uniref:tyrosine-protein kinase receptor torso n=1 Tax=Onthophagus taurus TaxID=166361 RepID=UPI0039BDA9AF
MLHKYVLLIFYVLCLFVNFSFSNVTEYDDLDPKTQFVICSELAKVESLNRSTCIQKPIAVEGTTTTKKYSTFQTLLCRDNDSLAFQLGGETVEKFTFVSEIANFNDSKWRFAQNGTMKQSKRFLIKNLKSATRYHVRTWLITDTGKVLQPHICISCRTSSNDDVPMPVEKIKLDKFVASHKGVDALVEFEPAQDLSCYYSYVYLKDLNVEEGRIEDINSLFRFTIPQLDYSQNYTIRIKATSKDISKESESLPITFETPSCLHLHKNLSICPPDPPTNIKVDEIYINRVENYSLFNLNISWAKPSLLPDHYEVSFDGLNESKMTLNISGNETSVLLQNVHINYFYHVFITAWSQKGSSKVASFSGEIKQAHHKLTGTSYYLIIVFVILSVTIAVCTTIAAKMFWMRYKQRRDLALQRPQYFKHLKITTKNPSYVSETICNFEMQGYLGDEWEVNPKDITLEAVVGQGAFGIVRYGWLKKDEQQFEVAVKMLKNAPTFDELRQFQQELEIMKTVGNHPHLVSLIGFSLKESYGPLLVVEYCSKGDLQSYLKSIWNKIINLSSDYLNQDMAVSNRIYDFDRLKMENEVIQPKELLSFARQIAIGMEYLANLKILHRDLAARNVLVCDDKTVKISDFGLSRDVYVDNVYRKTAGGKLPIRWMALECLTHQQYTTQSDVWSFGILLWEIINLGGNPYPGVQTEHLLKLLKSGYRMECPSNCGNEIYDIMSSCWRMSPKDRPTFTEIRHSIEALMEDEMEYLHIDLNTCIDINNTHSSNAKDFTIPKLVDRYVKPRWNIHK